MESLVPLPITQNSLLIKGQDIVGTAGAANNSRSGSDNRSATQLIGPDFATFVELVCLSGSPKTLGYIVLIRSPRSLFKILSPPGRGATGENKKKKGNRQPTLHDIHLRTQDFPFSMATFLACADSSVVAENLRRRTENG
jgi:hypothetical protein